MLYRYRGKNTYCRCTCDCGNETIVYAGNIKKGATRSCGCYEAESRLDRKHFEDLTGQTFGDLTVIKKTDKKASNGSVIWNCKCKCGSFREVSSGNLKRGHAISCGCRDFENVKVNLSGKKFGLLTALTSTHRNKKTAWNCLCDCGNQCVVQTSDLTAGTTISCGCSTMSSGELYIDSILEAAGVPYQRQYRIEDCRNKRPLPFDFCIFNSDESIKTLVEYQGQQHYNAVDFWGGELGLKQRQMLDKIKSEYCETHGIPLLVIPYTCSKEQIKTVILNTLDPVTITA